MKAKPMGCSKSSSKKEVHSNLTSGSKKKSKINNLTLHLRKLERKGQTKPKVRIGKEIKKIRMEVSETEMKKTIGKINETKS